MKKINTLGSRGVVGEPSAILGTLVKNYILSDGSQNPYATIYNLNQTVANFKHNESQLAEMVERDITRLVDPYVEDGESLDVTVETPTDESGNYKLSLSVTIWINQIPYTARESINIGDISNG